MDQVVTVKPAAEVTLSIGAAWLATNRPARRYS
jgi:hypothetical protein